jgi:hypothetical protein
MVTIQPTSQDEGSTDSCSSGGSDNGGRNGLSSTLFDDNSQRSGSESPLLTEQNDAKHKDSSALRETAMSICQMRQQIKQRVSQ